MYPQQLCRAIWHRREFILRCLAAGAAVRQTPVPIEMPLLCVTNKHAKTPPAQVASFQDNVWAEAVAIFARAGITLRVIPRVGEVLHFASGRPRFMGLQPGIINVILTDFVPKHWDNGRLSAGVTTMHEGVPLTVISMQQAHGNRLPFVAVNTVVHELLHILLQDIFVPKGGGTLATQARETRVDWLATRMWLFDDAGSVRQATQFFRDNHLRYSESSPPLG